MMPCMAFIVDSFKNGPPNVPEGRSRPLSGWRLWLSRLWFRGLGVLILHLYLLSAAYYVSGTLFGLD